MNSPDPDDRTETQKVRDRWEQGLSDWRPYRDAAAEEKSFLEGDRYADDAGAYNKDRRLIQIRGQETQDTIRHVVAKITERPRNIEARPVDSETDPEFSEPATALLEWDLNDPFRGFNREFYHAVQAACEMRLGCVFMDFDKTVGQFGEILDTFTPMNRIMWDMAYHPHHPKCGWLIRERRIDYREANRMYGVTWIKPDKDCFDSNGVHRTGLPVMRSASGDRLPYRDSCDDDKATIIECWYKNDYTKKPPKVTQEPEDQELKPKERYMACKGDEMTETPGCGFRSETQGQLLERSALAEGEELPDFLEGESPENPGGGCPDCGYPLERIDAKEESVQEMMYKKGRRLVSIAPFSPNPKKDTPCYDGEWPITRARSFPCLFITRYVDPGRPMGVSDVYVMWDQQLASDELATLAIQRVYEHRNYWIMPWAGIVDYKGERYEFRDDQFNTMFRDARYAEMGPLNVERVEGSGLDPSWSMAYNAVQAGLTRFRPQLDIGPAEERSRDIPVGTIERQTAEAEVSTEDFVRRINDELGMYYGVRWDYLCATLTYEKAARLKIEGIDLVLNMMGDALPNYDFVVTESRPFTGLEKAKSEAAQALLGIAERALMLGLDPAIAVEWFAEMNDIPRSAVKKFQTMWAARIPPPMPTVDEDGNPIDAGAGAVNAGAESGGNAPPGAPPLQPEMNGGGMVPQPVA